MSSADKRRIFESVVATGVRVHLDPRRDGVVVPMYFAKCPSIVLFVGTYLSNEPSDLRVDDAGFSRSLTFLGQSFHCKVPWRSVFAFVEPLIDSPLKIWHDDAPPEIRTATSKSASKAALS